MGTWFVIGNIPTPPERHAANAVEQYTYINNDGKASYDFDIQFGYNKGEPITGKFSTLPQKGYVKCEDKKNCSEWAVSPFWPVKLPYKIIELDDADYQYCVVGYPSRAYAWIMGRNPQLKDDIYEMLCQRMVEKHQYDLKNLRKVPQKWTLAEREKRGFSGKEIPDDMLVPEEEGKASTSQ